MSAIQPKDAPELEGVGTLFAVLVGLALVVLPDVVGEDVEEGVDEDIGEGDAVVAANILVNNCTPLSATFL
jgi:hypothetical protein